MKMLAVLCSSVLIVLAAEMAQAGDAYSRTEAERYIKDGEAAWAESVATRDDSVVKRISADDFVWVLDGEVLDKSCAVSDVTAGSPLNIAAQHADCVSAGWRS